MDARETFNKVATVYDAARPDYPEALFDDLFGAVHLAADDVILEVGCGTGQATQGLARRGHHIVALDPGPELLRIARQRLASFQNIEFIESSFEAWPAKPAGFKLMVAGQSFHWLTPDVRFIKAATVLRPGGVLAVFGNVPLALAPPLRDAVQRAYAQYAPHLSGPAAEDWYLPSGPIQQLFADSWYFAATTHTKYPWSRLYTTSSYTNLLRSLSGHQLLEPEQREALLAAVAAAITAHRGEFELRYEAHMYVATMSGRGHR